MLRGHRSAWRRRGSKSRAARIAVPLAIPMALGLTLGIVLAVSGGNTTHIQQSSLGASASARAVSTAPAVQAVSSNNPNCDIIVPAHPLSAQGLATPYQLTGPAGTSAANSGCTMTNAANLGAFVQATILDPRTGALSVYNPLVITQGTTPAAAPVVPKLPRNAIVTIDFGFNGTNLTQVGATPNALRQGRCVNGLGSVFGQQSFCNGINFFRAAYALMAVGRVHVPRAGTSAKIVPTAGRLGTGSTCPTVRNFEMVDQDQSDNVTSVYLLNPTTGQTAQDTAANEANMTGKQALGNGSDNALIDRFMDPALGCTPFTAPDLANNNDPAKTNLYRAEVGQAAINRQNDRNDSPANYCQNMINIQGPFLAANQAVFAGGPSPVPAVGEDLFTFLANRLLMSFDNLGCKSFGLTNPVTVVLDGAGATTSATINTTPQQASIVGGAGATGGGGGGTGDGGTGGGVGAQAAWQQIWQQWTSQGGQRKGRDHHQLMDPSGE